MTSVLKKRSYVNHSNFLDILWEAVSVNDGKRKIRLVSLIRSDDWLGDVDDDWFGVFIPDFHLLSEETQKEYSYGFYKLNEGQNVNRLPLLNSLIEACLLFREKAADVKFKVFHMGDLIDMWRERQKEDISSADIAQRVFNLGTFSKSKFFKSQREIDFLLGNHDHLASEIYDAEKVYFPVMRGNKLPVLVTHGDIFDKLEALDDDLQSYILNMAQKSGTPIDPGSGAKLTQMLIKLLSGKIAPNRYELIDKNLLYHNRQLPRVLEEGDQLNRLKAVNVRKLEMDIKNPNLEEARKYHPLLAGYPEKEEGVSDTIIDFIKEDTRNIKGLIDSVLKMRRGEINAYEKFMKFRYPQNVYRLPDLKVVVIGHTHIPGLITVGDPQTDGFLVMDCGAWVEEIKWPGTTKAQEEILPSCQIGVLCGNEARIYQIDP